MARRKTDSREERRALFRAMIEDLQREREELRARLAEIDSELAEYGVDSGKGDTPRGARAPASGRAPRAGSLKAAIVAAVAAGASTPAEITEAVLAAGYQSKSKALRQQVSVACGELARSGLLVRSGRGRYAAP